MTLDISLSPQQNRIWSLQNEGHPLAIQASLTWKGPLDKERLKNSLVTLENSKDILRTEYQIKTEEGNPVQMLHDTSKIAFNYEDISQLNPAGRSKKIDTHKSKASKLSIHTANCITQIHIFKIEELEFELLVTLPALAADSRSIEQIIRQLLNLYQGKEHPQEVISYRKFSKWQQQLLSEPNEDAAYFWQQYLLKTPLPSTIPFQSKAIPPKGNKLVTKSISVEKELKQRISMLLKDTNANTAAFMMVCLAILTRKYNTSNQVTIANVAGNRKYKELFPTIGALAKTLPVFGEITLQDPVNNILEQWQETIENTEAWSEYFKTSMLHEDEQKSNTPLYPVGFEYIDLSEALPSSTEIQCEWKAIESNTENFPVKFTCIDLGSRLQIALTYDTSCFSATAVQLILQQYEALLHDIVTTGLDTPVDAIAIQSIEENSRIIQQFGTGPNVTIAKSIVEAFQSKVTEEPTATALVCEGRTVSYHQLNQQSNQTASYLSKEYGLGKQDKIVLLADRSEWAITVMLASLKLGAVYVPIDTSSPAKQVNYILTDTQAKVTVLQNETLTTGLALGASKKLILDSSIAEMLKQPADAPTEAKEMDDVACIMYTQSDSGKLTGVQLTEQNLMNHASWANTHYFKNTKGNTFGLFTSLAFETSITGIFTTLLRGDQLNIYPQSDIKQNLTAILAKDSPVNVLKINPSLVSLLQGLGLGTGNITTIVLESSTITHNYIQTLQQLNPDIRIFNEYGSIETTVSSVSQELQSNHTHTTIGRPVANTTVYILNNAREVQPVGVPGEMYISGSGVCKGYLRKKALIKEKFLENPFQENNTLMYRTGDFGRWLPDGTIEYLGNKNSNLKINGHEIALKTIETALLSYETVREVIAVPKNEEASISIVAFFKAETTVDVAMLKTFLATKLPAYMIPGFYKQLDDFPLTVNGKIDMHLLATLELKEEVQKTGLKPRNEIEEEIRKIWADVLGIPNISVQDKFFDLGGHSIKAVKIVAKINQNLNVLLSLDALLDNASVEDLARMVSSEETTEHQAISTLKEQEYYDVSYAQGRLWVLNQMEANNIIHNMPQALLLKGPFNREAFNRTMLTMVKRHESLRTNFVQINDVPKQKIVPISKLDFKVSYTDLREDKQAMETALHLAQKEAATPFNFQKDYLFRVQVIQIANEENVVLFTMHHIISDAWSIGLLTNEIAAIYNAYNAGIHPPLNDLKLQYKDYAAWQKQQLEGEELQTHRQYWLDKLQSFPEKINLSTDFPRPEVKKQTGKKTAYMLDENLTRQLNNLSQEQQVSLFTLLLSAMYTLFYKLTKQEDIVIGTSVAGREHADLEGLVGFFVNLLALRTQFSGEETFTTLLEKAKDTILGAFSHQVYPFDKLVEDMDIEREMNQSPLFDVLVVFQNTEITEIDIALDGLSVEDLGGDLEKCEFDIIFNFIPTEKGILLNTHFSDELYEAETILIMTKKFELICQAIAAQPQVKLQDINIELEEEKKIKENNVSLDFNF